MKETPIVAVTEGTRDLFWTHLGGLDGIKGIEMAPNGLQASLIYTNNGSFWANGDLINAEFRGDPFTGLGELIQELPDVHEHDFYHIKIGPFLLVADNGLITCYSYA